MGFDNDSPDDNGNLLERMLGGNDAPTDDLVLPATDLDIPEADMSFDPSGDTDTILGDPDGSEFWIYQGDGNGTCAPTSVAMVLSEILGIQVDTSDAVVSRALDMGLIEFDPDNPDYKDFGGWSGMTEIGAMALLESYGVDANYRYGDLDDLAAYLDAGHAIMIAVDSSEVWENIDDDSTDGGQAADHMLVVKNIDVSTGTVALNDPGDPDGSMRQIPLDQFLDAWSDSGNGMIVTDLAVENVLPSGDAEPPIAIDTRGLDDVAAGPGAEAATEPAGPTDLPPTPPTTPPATPDTGSETDFELDRIKIEPPESLDSGVMRVILLAFTFVVRAVDAVR